jgi:hypothetical protein
VCILEFKTQYHKKKRKKERKQTVTNVDEDVCVCVWGGVKPSYPVVVGM